MDRGEEKFTDRSAKSSSQVADQGDGFLYAQDNDYCTYNAILGEFEQLLEQNALLMKILASFDACKEPGKVNLLSQARSNIPAISNKYASDNNIVLYAKIAAMLPNKTIRDVALHRKRMMNELENSLSQTQSKIVAIKKQLSEMPEPMKRMLPLRLELYEELGSMSFLRSSM